MVGTVPGLRTRPASDKRGLAVLDVGPHEQFVQLLVAARGSLGRREACDAYCEGEIDATPSKFLEQDVVCEWIETETTVASAAYTLLGDQAAIAEAAHNIGTA